MKKLKLYFLILFSIFLIVNLSACHANRNDRENLTIFFITNSDDDNFSLQTKYNEKLPIPTTPSKTGYEFMGWFDNSNTKWDFNTPLTKEFFLYAKWELKYYELEDYTDGLNFSYKDGYYYISSYDGLAKEIIIPSVYNDNINGFNYVKEIGHNAFKETNVIKVLLPETIEIIASNAFFRCGSLNAINIPKSVSLIGASAFHECSNLKRLEIINENIVIEADAFSNLDFEEFLFSCDAPKNVSEKAFSGTFSPIYYMEGTNGWDKYYFKGCPLKPLGYKYEIDDYELENQIALWNKSSLEYAHLMYSNDNIFWDKMLNTTNDDERAILKAFILELTKDAKSDEEKVLLTYNWIIENIIYDEQNALYFSAFETFTNKLGVCAGMSLLFCDFLRILNIPVLYVTGYYQMGWSSLGQLFVEIAPYSSDISHAWNYVYLNNEWIIIDLTNDFYNIDELLYNDLYFAQSVENITYYLPGMDLEHAILMLYRDGLFMHVNSGHVLVLNRSYFSHNYAAERVYYSNKDAYYIGDEDIPNGAYIFNGWLDRGNELYYLRFDAQSYQNVEVLIDDKLCFFDLEGKLLTIIEKDLITDSGLQFEYSKDRSSINIVYYYGKDEVLVIPSEINGVPVKNINKNAFTNNTSLKKVIINEGIINIHEHAFFNCENLEEIILPNSLIKIGDLAFYNCNSLQEINLPNNVLLYERVFAKCLSLEKIITTDHKTYISIDGVLYSKDKKALIIYPAGKISHSYEVLDGIKTIRKNAFEAASNLINVSLPDSLEVIEESAFESCINLTTIELPSSIKTISNHAFFSCESLETIIIPDSVVNFGLAIFPYCYNLKFIKLPNSLDKITHHMFFACYNLEEIILSKNIKTIENGAFMDCNNIKNIFYEGTKDEFDLIYIISDYNEGFLEADVYFYNHEKPHDSGNYWYYENNYPVIW